MKGIMCEALGRSQQNPLYSSLILPMHLLKSISSELPSPRLWFVVAVNAGRELKEELFW